MRLILGLVVGLWATSAQAVGVGSTYLFPGETFSSGGAQRVAVHPTLDLYFGDMQLQIHALDTFTALGSDTLFLGANGTMTMGNYSLGTYLEGIAAPGVSVDFSNNFDADRADLVLLGILRIGVGMENESIGVGMYVVPGAGIAILDGELELAASGTLQVSVWFPEGI